MVLRKNIFEVFLQIFPGWIIKIPFSLKSNFQEFRRSGIGSFTQKCVSNAVIRYLPINNFLPTEVNLISRMKPMM